MISRSFFQHSNAVFLGIVILEFEIHSGFLFGLGFGFAACGLGCFPPSHPVLIFSKQERLNNTPC